MTCRLSHYYALWRPQAASLLRFTGALSVHDSPRRDNAYLNNASKLTTLSASLREQAP